jgi:hypothetical protein
VEFIGRAKEFSIEDMKRTENIVSFGVGGSKRELQMSDLR